MEKATRDSTTGGSGGLDNSGVGGGGGGGGRPNLLRADPQSLPMPDMCIIETVPINEILAGDAVRPAGGGGGGGGSGQAQEDDQREMQTSFITFKPTPSTGGSGGGVPAGGGPPSSADCKSCCTRPTDKNLTSLQGSGTIPIYDRRRREIQTSHAPYGTLGEHARSNKTIYETTPRKNCAECVRDTESIYSTRQRELLNANNLSNSANNANEVSASKAGPKQTVWWPLDGGNCGLGAR